MKRLALVFAAVVMLVVGCGDDDGGTTEPQQTPTGACCVDGACTITKEADCSGVWQGADTVCDPNPCPEPTGACCAFGTCTVTAEVDCEGNWQGEGTTCDPNPCTEPTGACCIDETCSLATEAFCSGIWLGADTVCDPNPCGGPVYLGLDYFPMTPDDTWNYEYTGESELYPDTTGTVTFTEETHTFTDGMGRRSEWEMAPMDAEPEFLFFGDVGGNVVWVGQFEDGAYSDDPVVGLAVILPDTMRIGDEWGLSFVGGGGSGELEFLGIEDVVVPAGTFEDCLKVRSSLVDDEEPYDDYLYFAKHVGIVKAERFWEEQNTVGFFLLVNSNYRLAELGSAIVDGVSYP